MFFFPQGMRYKLNYDGMWHLDIPKIRQYDHGKVEVIARNVCGESRVETMLTVKSRHDDYRGVLKNSPRRKYTLFWMICKMITGNALNHYLKGVYVILIFIKCVCLIRLCQVQFLTVNNATLIINKLLVRSK